MRPITGDPMITQTLLPVLAAPPPGPGLFRETIDLVQELNVRLHRILAAISQSYSL
jgi:hypothetical protein